MSINFLLLSWQSPLLALAISNTPFAAVHSHGRQRGGVGCRVSFRDRHTAMVGGYTDVSARLQFLRGKTYPASELSP